jgi:hypothetical protein
MRKIAMTAAVSLLPVAELAALHTRDAGETEFLPANRRILNDRKSSTTLTEQL